jgi:DNA-3-methyladenine glycosylase
VLPRAFYNRDTTIVARELLGMHLVHVVDGTARVGRIVETEAYLGPHDLAAHSSKGLTARTRVMFGPPGHAYVYLVYGLHCCLNVVTEGAGSGSAVLLRALEPVAGVDARTRGPGLLCRAMGIDRRHDGADLLSPALHLVAAPVAQRCTVVRGPRVGVAYAGHWARRLLRFCIKDSPWLSRP